MEIIQKFKKKTEIEWISTRLKEFRILYYYYYEELKKKKAKKCSYVDEYQRGVADPSG